MALYQDGARDKPSEEPWHFAGRPDHPGGDPAASFGGLTFLYEDVTARLTLESDYNTLDQGAVGRPWIR